MRLFVGLGNPGAKYAMNRHNVGFMAVDRIAADHGFPPWRSKFQAELSEGRLGGEKVVLLKPQTFMNLSGQAVGEAMRFYRLEPADLVVFHDELDLAPGRLRVKTGGGHAGHNGLRSLHQHVGEGYQRVRIGIGHPGHRERVTGWVLADFAKADRDWLEDLLRGISEGAPALAAGDAARFMNAVALRVAPPRSSDRPGRGAAPAGQAEAAEKAGAKRPAAPAEGAGGTARPAGRQGQQAQDGQAGEAEDGQQARSALQRLIDRFR